MEATQPNPAQNSTPRHAVNGAPPRRTFWDAVGGDGPAADAPGPAEAGAAQQPGEAEFPDVARFWSKEEKELWLGLDENGRHQMEKGTRAGQEALDRGELVLGESRKRYAGFDELLRDPEVEQLLGKGSGQVEALREILGFARYRQQNPLEYVQTIVESAGLTAEQVYGAAAKQRTRRSSDSDPDLDLDDIYADDEPGADERQNQLEQQGRAIMEMQQELRELRSQGAVARGNERLHQFWTDPAHPQRAKMRSKLEPLLREQFEKARASGGSISWEQLPGVVETILAAHPDLYREWHEQPSPAARRAAAPAVRRDGHAPLGSSVPTRGGSMPQRGGDGRFLPNAGKPNGLGLRQFLRDQGFPGS